MNDHTYEMHDSTEPRTEKFWVALIVAMIVLSIAWLAGA